MTPTTASRSAAPFTLRTALVCAAFALGGTLAQAQTGGATIGPSSASSPGQSTAPHTTNTQSAVSDKSPGKATSASGHTSGATSGGGMGTGSMPAAQMGSNASGKTTMPAERSSAADSAFQKADANHDGQLSMAEADKVPGLSKRFKELDKDHNGTLSRNEFSPAARP